jgi:hypothetical protein
MGFEDQKDIHGVRPGGRKPYRKPELQIYGDLSSITRTVNITDKNEDHGDGPMDSPDKT